MDQSMTDNQLPEMAGELPDEIRDYIDLQKAKTAEKIEALGQAVAKKRDEAVKGRAGQGIEEEWADAEDQYQGIDDANRTEAKVYKPMSPNGSFTHVRRDPSRSTVFLNITRPYTDAAVARVTDMLLPTDDRNWAIRPTPIPQLDQLVKQKNELQPAPVPPTGAVPPGAMPAAPEMGMNVPKTGMAQAMEQAVAIMDAAKQKAEKAQTQIEDWHVECQYQSEVRKIFEDCSRLGTGVLKGPFPTKRKRMKMQQGAMGVEMMISMEIAPSSKRVDPWNIFPDPACGEDVHSGQYIVERDFITARQLRDLKGLPGYSSEMIDRVLEEGPNKINLVGGKNPAFKSSSSLDTEQFEIWYFHGFVSREDLEAMSVDVEGSKSELIPAVVTLINESPIKAALNPLDSGEFPYDFIPWQRRAGMPWGIGIPMQIRAPQRMINAATRNMMDNAGLSGGPQIVVRRNLVKPADGSWTLSPRKVWYVSEDGDARSVADAIMAINIPSLQNELMAILQFAMKMAEDVTGLPMILQGQLGKAPDTVGGMQMLTNNANSVLRRIARTFDDCVTEPHIRRYYTWLMQYGDEECKGDFTIDARGSSALVERDIANQAMMQLSAIAFNPASGIDPEKYIPELLKSQRIDPKKVMMDDEKKAQLAQQPPPMAPQVQAAQIRAQTELEKAKMANQAQMYKVKVDTDRDRALVQSQMRRDQAQAMSRVEELRIKREIAYLTAQIQKGISVDDNKVKLATKSMELRTQKELSLLGMHKDVALATPPTEPAGRAPNGQSYQA